MGKPSAWLNMSQRPFSYGNSERMKESSLGGNTGSWRQWSEEEDVNDSSPRSDSRAEKSLFSYPDVLWYLGLKCVCVVMVVVGCC